MEKLKTKTETFTSLEQGDERRQKTKSTKQRKNDNFN